MFSRLEEILFRKVTREERIIKKCGNICYCQGCFEPLNDQADVKEDDEGLVEYTCNVCDTISVFHFGIAPVPIFLETRV